MDKNRKYWNDRYLSNDTPWDLQGPSPPLAQYLKGIPNKSAYLLFPGAGYGHEVAFAHQIGLTNSYYLDFSQTASKFFKERNPSISELNILTSDFFSLSMSFDYIIEQTFFCALNPDLRKKYVETMHRLLSKGGKLAGLFFATEFDKLGPPFGATEELYRTLFGDLFYIPRFEIAKNSVGPRAGNEYFFEFEKIEKIVT